MADRQHRHHAREQNGRKDQIETLRDQRDQTPQTGNQAECANPGNATSPMLVAHRPAAFHADQQACRQRDSEVAINQPVAGQVHRHDL